MNLEQRELIESIIRQNPAFLGNEHLLDQFCSEVYKKSYLLLDSVSNVDSLKNYLKKVVDTSISNVVKANKSHALNDNDVQEVSKKSDSVEELSVLSSRAEKKYTPKTKIVSINKKEIRISKIKNPYEGLIDPIELMPEKAVNPSLAKNIVDAVIRLDSKEPSKRFLDIFKLKYVQKFPQSDISKALRISQNDLSKRFCEMVKLIRQEIL